MSATPLLTICIPTYNRAGHLEKLLEYLTSNLALGSAYDAEIVVVNNCAKDHTRAVLDKFVSRGVRVINRETFLLTAEENIINSLEFCHGEYVWFLGDDDVPVLQNFRKHYKRLEEGTHDYFLFNPAMMDPKGTVTLLQNIKMNRDVLELSMPELVSVVGLLFTFAGISNQIIRRRLLSTERGVRYLQRSKIYSMVAWIIDAGRDARAAFVNSPLVYYRENDYGNDHWERVAQKMGVGDYYFWSIGLVDLLEELIDQRCLTPFQVGQILEVTRDGTQYRLIDDMLNKLLFQIQKGRATGDARQILSQEQIQRAATFFVRADGTSYDIVQLLKELHSLPPSRTMPLPLLGPAGKAHKIEARLRELFIDRRSLGHLACRVQSIFCGYEVIQTPIQYTAVFAGDPEYRDKVMQVVDPLAQEPYVIVGSTWEELRERILTAIAALPREAGPTSAPLQTTDGNALHDAFRELNAVYNSFSWQLTFPYRFVYNSLRGIAGTITKPSFNLIARARAQAKAEAKAKAKTEVRGSSKAKAKA